MATTVTTDDLLARLAPGTSATDLPSASPQLAGPDNKPTPVSDPRLNSELANRVRAMFIQARDHRRPLMPWWRKHYQTLNLRTWASPTAENSWTPSPRIAKVWPILSSLVAWMTDQRPIIQVAPSPEPFSPFGDYYQAMATDMNTTIRSSFSTHQLDAEITRMLWDVGTYGIGWVKTVWEPWLADGLGDAVFRRKDPFTIYPDPFARTPDAMNYLVEAKVVTIDDLDRAFPGAADLLADGAGPEDVDEAPHVLESTTTSTEPRANLGALSPSTSSRYTATTRASAARRRSLETPTVTLLECWVREHTVEPTDDPDVKKVIDRWRCIVVVGNLVLFDKYADECSAHNTHPYDRCVLFDTGEMYGPSLVHFLTSPQESINRTLAAIEHNMMLMGNPVIVESPRSQSRQQQITNRPGQRIKAQPDTDFKWLNPPQMQPQIAVQLMNYYDGQIEVISGLSAIVRGFSPTGRNAQGVLDSVQDAAFVRIRATLRELERTLRGAAHKMAATIAEFYTEPRLMSIIGDDGQHVHRALRARHFYSLLPGDAGERIPLRFTLLADAGSTLPTSQQARAGDAMTLFGLGAIDELELLKAMNWPNYAITAKRVMEAKAAGAMQPPGKRQAARA